MLKPNIPYAIRIREKKREKEETNDKKYMAITRFPAPG